MTRYIGLDAHAKSCTFGVIDDSGRRLKHAVVETDAKCLVEFVKTVSRPRYVCLEEGAQSAWLYEVLSPHNDEVIVTTVGQSRGNKDDKRDAFKAAENLRMGSVTPVYKERGPFSQLICVARMYGKLVGDKTRTQNRLKALYRSRGVNTPDGDVYTHKHRQLWLDKLAAPYRSGAELYYAQLDVLGEVEQQASKRLSAEVRKHDISRVLMSCPGIGPVRAAELMGIMVTPYRFRTKRQLWTYSGLSVVMRSTNDWAPTPNGWQKVRVAQTRGLNTNCNYRMKKIFKGAATTVIQKRQRPLYDDYLRMLEQGTKPPMAKLTLARKIAATLLSMWKSKEVYDPSKDRDNS